MDKFPPRFCNRVENIISSSGISITILSLKDMFSDEFQLKSLVLTKLAFIANSKPVFSITPSKLITFVKKPVLLGSVEGKIIFSVRLV